ncbi:hypothetical protein Nepgr_005576 [Nepenthes gracilis]|uniref:Ribosomal eL28/Mak16 domain-containing protein n=1 Tax=Nepenthes gracilis TaxID=150966 RepID=A0AAD3S3W4_NEPGR|nr:hypothetical protein Nepgr_005576 [Nepenthes gracilis]
MTLHVGPKQHCVGINRGPSPIRIEPDPIVNPKNVKDLNDNPPYKITHSQSSSSSPLFSVCFLPEANLGGEFPSEMATVPGAVIWEIVKKNNSFLVKQFGNGTAKVQFSRESDNLLSSHSYKYSGLANPKTVSIQPGGQDNSVVLATKKTRKQNKPGSMLHKSLMKKEFHVMAKVVTNQVGDNYYRPDLKKAALARLSVVHRSLQVAKSGVKKRTRQASKIPARK